MDSTVSRTLPGLKRELEAFYSSSAMLMSWRAIRTVCQADLVRLHLIRNNSIFGRKCNWRWRWRCPWLLTMSGHCHPSAFDWSWRRAAEQRQWTMAHSAGTGDLILKQSTPLRPARPRGDNCTPMNGTTGSQSLVIEASRMKGEENWAVATKGTKEASHHWPALTQQHKSSFRFRISRCHWFALLPLGSINQQQRQQQQTTALFKFPDGRTLSVTAPEAEVADVGVPRLSARYSMSYSFPLLDLDFCLIPLATHRTTQEPCGWSPLPIKSCTPCTD